MITDFAGRTAVITGGGGLLGRGMATAFARAGMNVVVADLDADAALATVDVARVLGSAARLMATAADVTDPESMRQLADATYEAFGEVNVLCLNAGLAILKPFEQLTRDDWHRVLDVQFGGVLNGVLEFLPRLIAQGGDRHIVATSSMSGVGRADLRSLNAPYVTAKFAVVGLTEVMEPALRPHGIGVSVLCPGMTVADPPALRESNVWAMPSAAWYRDNLLDEYQVGEEVLHGIREGRTHIFPHRSGRAEVDDRHAMLSAAFDAAERTSPPINQA
ncbi:MAG: SDR family NAD(P)-dependent oxidoreductase [Acidimicrobiia bacterium]